LKAARITGTGFENRNLGSQSWSFKTQTKEFDLNIEEMLENWEVEHALREIIANALDEQVISGTAEIQIFKSDEGAWHIRDFGRGLRIEHFTLNENQEKLNSNKAVIGKFGVGLKDALATFFRRGIRVKVRSQFGTYLLKRSNKHGFSDITTLHVEYDQTPLDIRGTEFILSALTDADVAKAKSLFLRFAGDNVLESSAYGQILERGEASSRVYILGVLASEEPNFLFSYNITNLTDSMKKKLNRERLNVGRTTYAERVKAILKGATNRRITELLVEQVSKRAIGEQCDEMSWIEISQFALNLMHEQSAVVYFTETDLLSKPNIVDSARSDGYQVIVVSERQKEKLDAQVLSGGPQVRTVSAYIEEYNASFDYRFVDYARLTSEERQIFDLTPKILALIGTSASAVPDIRISETMRLTTDDTEGVWDSSIRAIVIKRGCLASVSRYAATLLHELAHAISGTVDATREFEAVLTDYLGRTAKLALPK
jgi:hypothetical protein